MRDNTKIVKQALAKKYGFKNVSVKRDRGTASGWVIAKVNLDLPKNCGCQFAVEEHKWNGKKYLTVNRQELREFDGYDGHTYYCETCKNLLQKTNEEARKIVHNSGAKFGTYYPDDGYNTASAEVNISVEVGEVGELEA